MYRETKFELDKQQIEAGAKDLNEVRFILEQAALAPNSWQDELNEIFRELAALKGQTVSETLEEVNYGILQYLDAAMMPEPDTDSLAETVDYCYEQMKKLSISIEACWDFFSDDRRDLFIQFASDLNQKGATHFQGWRVIKSFFELLIPSILNRSNLFAKFKGSVFLIPRAVERAVELRRGKGNNRFSKVVELLLKEILKEQKKQSNLSSCLKNMGRDREEQIQKNQAAIAWAESRMREIEEKHNWNRVEF